MSEIERLQEENNRLRDRIYALERAFNDTQVAIYDAWVRACDIRREERTNQ